MDMMDEIEDDEEDADIVDETELEDRDWDEALRDVVGFGWC